MDLPKHIVDNAERRWAAKLQQEVDAWRQRTRPQQPQGGQEPRMAKIVTRRVTRAFPEKRSALERAG